MSSKFELRVDNYVRKHLEKEGLTFGEQHDLPLSIKECLEKASKSGDSFGKPDFVITFKDFPDTCVIIEDKYGLEFLKSETKSGNLATTAKAINDYALNGAVHYANSVLNAEDAKYQYNNIYALGIAGEGLDDELEVKYECLLYRRGVDLVKKINFKDFSYFNSENFAKNKEDDELSEREKHEILEKSLVSLEKKAKELNKLMNDSSISVSNRIIFVSGCLLACEDGLKVDDLKGETVGKKTDGKLIYQSIENNLMKKFWIDEDKRNMMLSQFNILNVDADNDVPSKSRSKKSDFKEDVSVNKEIFAYIKKNIFDTINEKSHIDSMGNLYSEFLKYAVGDGRELGLVLSPSYITRLMNKLIGVSYTDRVIDLCLGSAGFLVSAMATMIEDAHDKIADPVELEKEIKEIKANRLLGAELDLRMWTLACSNMILRSDGSSKIKKGDAFELIKEPEFQNFKPTKALLNPPFSYTENGMPFALAALNLMEKDGLLAIIIQDSAGTGKAVSTNKKILENNTLLASIKMPADLFQPSAGVQTSIYIFKAGYPHDVKNKVKFIDFSNDGYKRTGRGLRKVGDPDKRYHDVVDVYKYGDTTKDIDIVEDYITLSGKDWNYDQHRIIDTTPTEEDFMKTVGDFLEFEISQILKGREF